MLTNGKVILPADLPQCYNGIRKRNLLQSHNRVPYRKHLARLIRILIDNVDYLHHHIFFPTLAQQILLRHVLVDILIAPNFQFPPLADVEHVLEDLEMPVILVEDFEALQRHCQAMQGILKGDLVDLRQIGHYPFVVNTQLVLHIPAVVIPLDLQEQGRDEVKVLVAGEEGLHLAVHILSVHHPLFKLHNLLGVVEVAVDAQRTVAMRQGVIMHLRKVLPQLLTVLTVPHQFKK